MNSNIYIIAIAGPSCAGKTEVAKALARELRACVLETDHYYRDLSMLTPPERARINFDSPDALDHRLLIDHVQRLSRGEGIERPAYDFAMHTRRARGERLTATGVLIIEGIFALYWRELRRLVATKVFIDAADLVCFRRRRMRDVGERGRTLSSVITQFRNTVRPMAKQYVRPTSKYADLVLSGQQPLCRSVEQVLDHVYRHLAAGLDYNPDIEMASC